MELNLFFLFVGLFVMYWRTLKFHYVIDDGVLRGGYLYEVPLTAPTATKDEKTGIITPCVYDRRPSAWYRCFMIGMHCVNTYVVYLLWGWGAALLFALHPVCVWGTAWVTGNYYATTTYFCLIAYYIMLHFPNIWGYGVGMALYATALNSTIEALVFPFVLLCVAPFGGASWASGLWMMFPLFMFLRGKRFTTGIKIREDFISESRIKGFSPRRLILMVKVIGRYLFTALYPDRLGFFGPFGANIHDDPVIYKEMHKANRDFWWSLWLCLLVFGFGMVVHPVGTLWFFGFVALHSQWKIMGQFFAVRYLYIAVPGLCAVFGTVLEAYPIALAVLATYYAIRTHCHIFMFTNVEAVWQNDLETWPEHAQTWNNRAQGYMRSNQNGKSLKSWELNQMAALILRAQEMNPKAWEINMNCACFYAIIGQWPMCLKFTDLAIDLLKPLADKPCGPLKMLEEQRERIIKMAGDAVAAPVESNTNQGSAENFSPANAAQAVQKEGVDHGSTRTEETNCNQCVESK